MSLEDQPSKSSSPVSLRTLLTCPRVVISVSNYVSLAFLNIAFNALFPLFLSSSPMSYPPSTIGYIMGAYGFLCGAYQYFAFASVIRRWGERSVFIWGVAMYPLVFALFPLISTYAHTGIDRVLIAVIVVALVLQDMAFGAIFMYVTSSAPNPESLGATNGLSQTLASIARAVGPAGATSLWSLSVEKRWGGEGGFAVYGVFVVLGMGAVLLAKKLPEEMWGQEGED